MTITPSSNGHRAGFTIVELLIVIVVIAILAAITIVAYNGVQARARNSSRVSAIDAIQKALELYKTETGSYPVTSAFGGAATMCTGIASGYGYSFATDGTWLKPLIDQNVMSTIPTPPVNDCTHYIRYLHPSATSYSCTTRTSGYYILQSFGNDGFDPPAGAVSGTSWKPCPEAGVSWPNTSATWTFEKDDI